jgi:hypothetical protein
LQVAVQRNRKRSLDPSPETRPDYALLDRNVAKWFGIYTSADDPIFPSAAEQAMIPRFFFRK